MEYVPGSTLRRYCRADQLLSLELIVEIGFKCAMALGYVYRQGLIHRDVKPANLLVTLNNGSITDVKVSDFGSVLNLASDVTQVYRVGSLAYMSPEQLDGAALDCRADIYSLGAVLYHLIAGRPPFDAQAQSAMMHQIYHQQPAPLNGLRAGVNPTVDAVIQRALAKDPARPLPRLGRVRAGTVRPHHPPARAARAAAGRARLGAVQPAAHARLLLELRRRGAVGGGAPRQVAALRLRPRASTARARKGDTFHIIAKGELEVLPRRAEGGPAWRWHLGRRNGLPRAQSRPASATAPT